MGYKKNPNSLRGGTLPRHFFNSLLAVSLSTALLFLGCEKLKTNKVNILLISIDTLRADHLGCYGYHRDTSANIDSFALESIRYARAYAPSPWTLPSHAGMLSGLHPAKLGINSDEATILNQVPLITELLKEAGYQTAAFVDSPQMGYLGADRGFARGFDVYNHAPHKSNLKYIYDMAVTVEAANKWLENRNKKKPFFLFLHTKSVHSVLGIKNGDPRHFPYDKPEPYRSRYLTDEQAALNWNPPYSRHLLRNNTLIANGNFDHWVYPTQRIEALKGQYDGSIYYTDVYFGKLMKILDEMDLSKNTLVILTADHGEAFIEHKFFLHKEVYKQLLHVPLIIRLPLNRHSEVIETPVAIEDITPTILNHVNINIPKEMSGKILPINPAIKQSGRQFYGYYQFGATGLYDAFSLQEGDWKIVYHKYLKGKWLTELYNIVDDPDELSPVEGGDGRRAAMRTSLLEWITSHQNIESPKIQLDSETVNHLKSLGYLR